MRKFIVALFVLLVSACFFLLMDGENKRKKANGWRVINLLYWQMCSYTKRRLERMQPKCKGWSLLRASLRNSV